MIRSLTVGAQGFLQRKVQEEGVGGCCVAHISKRAALQIFALVWKAYWEHECWPKRKTGKPDKNGAKAACSLTNGHPQLAVKQPIDTYTLWSGETRGIHRKIVTHEFVMN